jgi:hypothetical protein
LKLGGDGGGGVRRREESVDRFRFVAAILVGEFAGLSKNKIIQTIRKQNEITKSACNH